MPRGERYKKPDPNVALSRSDWRRRSITCVRSMRSRKAGYFESPRCFRSGTVQDM